MITLSILAYSNLSLDDVMYLFIFFSPFNILLIASAKERKKNPDSTLHRAITRLSVSCLVLFTPPQTARLFVRCNGHMTSLGFRHSSESEASVSSAFLSLLQARWNELGFSWSV